MKQLKISLLITLITGVICLSLGDVRLDDFENLFAENPSQCFLGEAYGYSITKKWGTVDTGAARAGA